MSARSNILTRIRKALRERVPRPPEPHAGEVFSAIPPADLMARFEKELLDLKAEFHRALNWADAQAWVHEIARANQIHKVVVMPHDDSREATRLLNPPSQGDFALNGRVLTGADDCGHRLADVDLGVTVCDCLVACTGSVVLTTQTGFGRTLSVLPPAHLVVARRSQLVAHLADAYHLLQSRYGRAMGGWPSMMTIITGPSRTADIEKILVLGAHGPKKLFVLLLDF